MSINSRKISTTQLFEELEHITNFMPAPLYWLDTDGIVLGFNDAMGNMHGNLKAVRDKVIGKRHEDFYPPHVARVLNENNRRVLETGETIEFEETAVNVLTNLPIYYISIRSPWRDIEQILS